MRRQIAVVVALLAIVAHLGAAQQPEWILVTVTASQETREDHGPPLKIVAQSDVLEHDNARRLIRSRQVDAVYQEDGETIVATYVGNTRTVYWVREPIEAVCALLDCRDAAAVQRDK